jgi:hypothetical protein
MCVVIAPYPWLVISTTSSPSHCAPAPGLSARLPDSGGGVGEGVRVGEGSGDEVKGRESVTVVSHGPQSLHPTSAAAAAPHFPAKPLPLWVGVLPHMRPLSRSRTRPARAEEALRARQDERLRCDNALDVARHVLEPRQVRRDAGRVAAGAPGRVEGCGRGSVVGGYSGVKAEVSHALRTDACRQAEEAWRQEKGHVRACSAKGSTRCVAPMARRTRASLAVAR